MNTQIFLKWLKINSLCFIGSFVVTFLLVQLFPNVMLRLWGGLASFIGLTGVKGATQFSPDYNTFIDIFFRNSISVSIVFIVGLFFAAPILMLYHGLYYALVAGLAPLTGITFTFSGWILVATEALFLIVGATFASTLATEIFGIKPEIKQQVAFWKRELTDWKNLWTMPEQKRNWRIVLKENRKGIVLFILIILALLLFGAWFEVWGP